MVDTLGGGVPCPLGQLASIPHSIGFSFWRLQDKGGVWGFLRSPLLSLHPVWLVLTLVLEAVFLPCDLGGLL